MDMNYKVNTSKSLIQAVSDLKKCLADHKFGVLWELDFKEKLKEKGLNFDKEFIILEVCNPEQAIQLLEKDMEAGYFLPCKMVVYEDGDHVSIGMIKPTQLIKMIDNDELFPIARAVEKDLKDAMDEALLKD